MPHRNFPHPRPGIVYLLAAVAISQASCASNGTSNALTKWRGTGNEQRNLFLGTTAEILKNDKIIVEYLQAALEENDPAFFVKAVGNVAPAKGMARVAQNGRVGRQNLYKALSGKRDLRVSTLMKVLGSLGIQLAVVPKPV